MDALIGLMGFAAVTTITPGPNNAMLMASGATVGLRGSWRHMAGIMLGFAAMVLVLGAGLAPAVQAHSGLQRVMQAAGLAYVLWLAWKIAQARPSQARTAGRTIGLWQAAAFQWVNPKAWAMVLAALATYGAALGGPLPVALAFAAVGLPCHLLWVVAGTRIARMIDAPDRLRLFNMAMAGIMVLSMLPVLIA
ncbi:threonine/homoserine/homoserine lactone efflux protein [Stutzerimonas stutzeri]|nr:threonine/homoserine/homoserine lactone efflux protein [Stutzerimonas stutzeri]